MSETIVQKACRVTWTDENGIDQQQTTDTFGEQMGTIRFLKNREISFRVDFLDSADDPTPCYEMRLHDWSQNKIVFAHVYSIEEARDIWRNIAGGLHRNLCEFTVVDDKGNEHYRGSYVTDEC